VRRVTDAAKFAGRPLTITTAKGRKVPWMVEKSEAFASGLFTPSMITASSPIDPPTKPRWPGELTKMLQRELTQ
jgi:hypothetical protein